MTYLAIEWICKPPPSLNKDISSRTGYYLLELIQANIPKEQILSDVLHLSTPPSQQNQAAILMHISQ